MDAMDFVQTGQLASIRSLLADLAEGTGQSRAILQAVEQRLSRLEQELQWMQVIQRHTLEVITQQTGVVVDLNSNRQAFEAEIEAQRAIEAQRNMPVLERLKGFKMKPLPDQE